MKDCPSLFGCSYHISLYQSSIDASLLKYQTDTFRLQLDQAAGKHLIVTEHMITASVSFVVPMITSRGGGPGQELSGHEPGFVLPVLYF